MLHLSDRKKRFFWNG